MTRMTASRRARLLTLIVAGAVLLAGVFFWVRAVDDDSGAELVADSSAEKGWKTIEYQGIRVDIPAGWERSDMDDCEFQFEQWGPPDSPACDPDGGVAFYGSATFDPAHGPGLRRDEPTTTDASTWAGYVYEGDFAVYASDDDRQLVRVLLHSARTAQR